MTSSPPVPGHPTWPLSVPNGDVAGAAIIRELPADSAFWVWKVLREVLLWAREEGPRRDALFIRGSMRRSEEALLREAFEADIRYPLSVLAAEMDDPGADAARVSWSCLCVADWALGKRAPFTAMAYAEAAAIASPSHPRYAWLAGRLLRAHGRLKDAETWLARAIALASRAGDWEAQSRSLIGLGNLNVERGRFGAAQEAHSRALRVATRHNLREMKAMALHDLFLIAVERGAGSRTDEFARRAFEAYGTDHPRIPALAHDVAYHWMSQGHFSRAFDVFTALVPLFSARPEIAFSIVTSAARAAAACGYKETFDRLWKQAHDLAAAPAARSRLAAGLLEMAIGASTLGLSELAEEALSTATAAAQERGESNVLVRAEGVLQSIRNGEVIEVQRREASGVAPADLFARNIVQSLAQQAEDEVTARAVAVG